MSLFPVRLANQKTELTISDADGSRFKYKRVEQMSLKQALTLKIDVRTLH